MAALAAVILLISFSTVGALMGGRGLMWTVWQSEPVKLVVCWENPDDADPLPGEIDRTSGWQRREWVRRALKRSWEREARIIFVGWEECQNEAHAAAPPHTLGPRRPGTADENVKIRITTSGGGQNPAHGSWGDYQKSGVRLNLHCGSRECIEYLAIHEFGHVLGLYHGEERGDWDIAGCPRQTWDPSWPGWPVPTELRWGAPDRDSAMAYCSGRPTELSPRDVAGIQRAYQRHLPGTLLSLPGSLCLSAHANAANGSEAFGWACDEAHDDQEWRYDPAQDALYIRWPADPARTRRCLETDTEDPGNVQIWDCHDGPNQRWTFRRVMVRGYGGLCLTRPPAGAGALTMQPCTGGAHQLWRVDPGAITGFVRLRSDPGNLCLTLDGASGSDAVARPCSDHIAYLPLVSTAPTGMQRSTVPAAVDRPAADAATPLRDFLLGSGGTIVVPGFTGSSLCLDVQDVWDSQFTDGKGGPRAGQRVQFFTCYDAQLNQKWSLSGHVVSDRGACLGLSGSGVNDGAGAIVSRCSGAAQQDWDYSW